ncbi:MAG: PKD domain-containing protein, partial [Thermoplasmata archaeon]
MVSVGAVKLLNLPPSADAGPDIVAHPGEEIVLDGSDSQGNIVEYSWYVRDNSEVKSGAIVEHAFDKLGRYQVGLVVRADDYKMDLDYTTVDVINDPPICDLMGPYQTVEDEGVVFEWSAFDEYSSSEDMKYIWKFGDGTSYETSDPSEEISHVYSDEGVYSVTLIVEDEFGASCTDETSVQVSNIPPVCNFDVGHSGNSNSHMIYEDEEILFDAGSTIDTSSDLKDMDYHWDFGDGTES